jgi:hypothetical protein
MLRFAVAVGRGTRAERAPDKRPFGYGLARPAVMAASSG